MTKTDGPRINIAASCFDCKYETSERFSCQGDSGADVYCTHPNNGNPNPHANHRHHRHVSSYSWNTPNWCPLLAQAIAAKTQSVFSLADFAARQQEFSLRTFGHGMRTGGVTQHIEKECIEIRKDPSDRMEWIDVLILAVDGALRSGTPPEEIGPMMEAKLAINMKREWPAPTDQDSAIEHVRES